MWNRLIAVVEEQAQALIRTAFSTSTREAGDLSAGVFDLEGAHAGAGGHRHAGPRQLDGPRASRHFLGEFPADTMKPGDIYITNDPWKGTGHLHDFTVVTPTFQRGKLVALFACTATSSTSAASAWRPTAGRSIEEGLYIPLHALRARGQGRTRR